jgi:shikimate kinase
MTREFPRRIFLIGPRGSGKTTVGRLLAARLGWPFADMDDLIEARAGRSVAEIFAAEGEPEFRDREAATLRDVATTVEAVIATGGGVVLRDANRRLLRDAGFCVWLTADGATLWQRIQGDPLTGVRRPALTGLPGPDEVAHVVASREPLYREVAHLSLSTESASPEAAVSAILTACSKS